MQAAVDLASGEAVFWPQDPAQPTYWRKRSRADGLIDWRMHAESIYNFIRALAHPYPGAEFIYKGQSIPVWQSETRNENYARNIKLDTVSEVNETGITVKCGLNPDLKLKKVSRDLTVAPGDQL